MPLLGPAGVFCAIAFAAGVPQAPEPAREMRTKVLPGNGYIRYEVEPGDDQQPPGELIVLPPEGPRRPAGEAVEPAAPAAPVEPATKPAPRDPCAHARAQLLVRLFQMRGMQVGDRFAEWLEQNTILGDRGLPAIQVVSGADTLLLTAVRTDGIARGLAEDLARCEQDAAR